jgi:plastocyanin domain-containing protein
MTPMEYIGIAVVALHIIVIGTIVVWFALGKPKTRTEFRTRFLREFFGIHPRSTPHP